MAVDAYVGINATASIVRPVGDKQVTADMTSESRILNSANQCPQLTIWELFHGSADDELP